MTLARIRSGALLGIEGIPVYVEVDIGLPAFHMDTRHTHAGASAAAVA